MNNNELLGKGTELVKKFVNILSYVEDYPNYYWPKPSDITKDYTSATDIIQRLEDNKLDDDFNSLLLSELQVALKSQVLLIENWMFQKPVGIEDHLTVLAVGDIYYSSLNHKLENENAEEIDLAGYQQFKEQSSRWYGGIPQAPKFLNEFDRLFEETVDILFDIAENYLGESRPYTQKLKDTYTITYNLFDKGYRAQTDRHHKTVFFDSATIAYFEKGQVKINYSEFISLFAHELLGHALNSIITNEIEDLPEFLKLNRSIWNLIIKEEIARLSTKSFSEMLSENPQLLNKLKKDEDPSQLAKRIKRDFLLNRYFSDIRAYLFYTIIKDLEKKVEINETRKKLSKIVYPTHDYFDKFYSKIKSLVDENGKLSEYKLYYLTHAYHGIQGSKINIIEIENGKRRLNNKLLSGNWSNYGMSKWINLQNIT